MLVGEQKIINMKKMRITFVYYYPASFVKTDLKILQKHFDVLPIQFSTEKDSPKLIRSIWYSDLTFSWFAGWHSAFAVFFSKLFQKKSIVVVGGYECACIPEMGYGAFSKGRFLKEGLPAKYSLEHADRVLPVSNFTKSEVLRWAKPKQIEVVYNGVDIDKFESSGEKENNLVITVGAINWLNLKRKGIGTFVKSAKFIPDARFVVVGKFMDDSIDYLKSIASPKVEFTDFVSDEDLIKWYQKAKVICQLSYYEAFGLSPAEGMACGCIPVVTKERTGLPEFVGDTGFYVPYGDEKATAEVIKKALNAPDEVGKKARERIKNMFLIEKREKGLLKVIRNMIIK
jgi:glycosyltransferase involved in cell wall biosynthesis